MSNPERPRQRSSTPPSGSNQGSVRIHLTPPTHSHPRSTVSPAASCTSASHLQARLHLMRRNRHDFNSVRHRPEPNEPPPIGIRGVSRGVPHPSASKTADGGPSVGRSVPKCRIRKGRATGRARCRRSPTKGPSASTRPRRRIPALARPCRRRHRAILPMRLFCKYRILSLGQRWLSSLIFSMFCWCSEISSSVSSIPSLCSALCQSSSDDNDSE